MESLFSDSSHIVSNRKAIEFKASITSALTNTSYFIDIILKTNSIRNG